MYVKNINTSPIHNLIISFLESNPSAKTSQINTETSKKGRHMSDYIYMDAICNLLTCYQDQREEIEAN